MTEIKPLPNRKYNIIYADPPWKFKTYSEKGKGRSPENHYDCMALNEIKELPLNEIAAENCALFMWTTFPMLPQALNVIKAWGFEYKTTAFVWVKRNKRQDTYFTGLGYWTRSNAEICLLATRGKPKRINKSVHQIVDARIRSHSEKPPEVRDKIVKLCGDLPRIELFARQIVDGWDAWGNEIDERRAS